MASDPSAGLVRVAVAATAAHRLRRELEGEPGLAEVQIHLVQSLEALGDPIAAHEVAFEAAAGGSMSDEAVQRLAAAVIRTRRAAARARSAASDDLVVRLRERALSDGAMLEPEAQLWAAIELLDGGDRGTALTLARQVADLLDALPLDEITSRWRLLLAFHAGRAGVTDVLRRAIAPLLVADQPLSWVAYQVQRAVAGPGAAHRFAIAIFEQQRAALPERALDERLPIEAALAHANRELGWWSRAVIHSTAELDLRLQLNGADHPDTLVTRHQLAVATGAAGDPATARDQLTALLPDKFASTAPTTPTPSPPAPCLPNEGVESWDLPPLVLPSPVAGPQGRGAA